MKSEPVSLPRLSDLPPEQDPDGLGELFRSAQPLSPSPDAALRLIKWRIRSTLSEGNRRRGLALRPTLAVFLVFAGGGVLGASIDKLVRRTASPVAVPASPNRAGDQRKLAARSVRPHESRMGTDQVIAPAPSAEDPVPAVTPDRPVVAANVRGRSLPSSRHTGVDTSSPSPNATDPPPMPPLASASVPRSAEHALIATALQRLRAMDDPSGAIDALDQHAARFPGGVLAPEAAALRGEALLRLGRRPEALRELDALLAQPLPRAHERRVLRGEVRVLEGLYDLAVEDFDSVLRARGQAADPGARPGVGGPSESVRERALWGRAVARSRAGDAAGARADASTYLRRFPAGRFARDAGLLAPSP